MGNAVMRESYLEILLSGEWGEVSGEWGVVSGEWGVVRGER